jgi:hypothetical protein
MSSPGAEPPLVGYVYGHLECEPDAPPKHMILEIEKDPESPGYRVKKVLASAETLSLALERYEALNRDDDMPSDLSYATVVRFQAQP